MKDNNQDRVSKYLCISNNNMLFGELSETFLAKMGGAEMLSNVPVPISEGDNEQVTVKMIILDMAKVIGADANFIYAKSYIEYMKAVAGENLEPVLVTEGAKLADEAKFEEACKLLRAALLIEPTSEAALYLYGRCCKACYELEDKDEDYVGSFKAEALETFEIFTMLHPEFAMGYYFLGYGYLNLGLYLKAKLTFEDFIKYSMNNDVDKSGVDADILEQIRDEVSDILASLEEPVEIEDACNKITSGDFISGREILAKYTEGQYKDWWPLWYHLGAADASLGDILGAINDYKRALTLSPSNIDIMEALVTLYKLTGDEDSANKYRTKIEIVKRNIEEDQAAE